MSNPIQSIGSNWWEHTANDKLVLAAELKTLGDKFKEIEKSSEQKLDPSKYTILRVDGHCFSTFTRQFNKPCDDRLYDAMVYACSEWIKEFGGTCVYTQSDEATMIINRIEEDSKAELPYSGRIGKIATLSASLFSVYFNESLQCDGVEVKKPATFDARVFQVDTDDEVQSVIRWRQLDAFRNGVSSLARTIFSDKELHGVSVGGMLRMIDTETLNDYSDSHLMHGTFVKKRKVDKVMPNGEMVVRTIIVSGTLGSRLRIANVNKERLLSKYLEDKEPTQPKEVKIETVPDEDENEDANKIEKKILKVQQWSINPYDLRDVGDVVANYVVRNNIDPKDITLELIRDILKSDETDRFRDVAKHIQDLISAKHSKEAADILKDFVIRNEADLKIITPELVKEILGQNDIVVEYADKNGSVDDVAADEDEDEFIPIDRESS